jgi:hypothetical protein
MDEMRKKDKDQLVDDLMRVASDIIELANRVRSSDRVFVLDKPWARHIDETNLPRLEASAYVGNRIPTICEGLRSCDHMNIKRWGFSFLYEECHRDHTLFVGGPRVYTSEEWNEAFRHPHPMPDVAQV